MPRRDARVGGCVVLVACASLLAAVSMITAAAIAQGTASSIAAAEGVQFSGPVGTMSTSQCVTAPLTAGPSGAIAWGDGLSSPASYTYVTGTAPHQYTVSGSHTYAEEGNYTATVTTSYTCGTNYTSTFDFSAQAADAALSATAVSVAATAGQNFSGPVATFTDADSAGTASD